MHHFVDCMLTVQSVEGLTMTGRWARRRVRETGLTGLLSSLSESYRESGLSEHNGLSHAHAPATGHSLTHRLLFRQSAGIRMVIRKARSCGFVGSQSFVELLSQCVVLFDIVFNVGLCL